LWEKLEKLGFQRELKDLDLLQATWQHLVWEVTRSCHQHFFVNLLCLQNLDIEKQ